MANLTPYGFIGLEDLYDDRVSNVNVAVIDNAVQESVDWQTRNVNETMSAWVDPTTEYQEKFVLPGTGELQPLDADGIPVTTKAAGNYTVSYPIQGAGDAYGDNRVTRAQMTVREVARQVLSIQSKDSKWLRRHYLGAMLDNVAWTYDDKQHGSLSITPLANNDAVKYVNKQGDLVTANHYSAQAAAISDAANPFGTIYDTLEAYPSNMVSGNNPVVSYVSTSLRASIRGLAGFVGPQHFGVVPGANQNTLDPSVAQYVLTGMRLLGAVDDCLVIEWGSLPTGYIFSWATGAGPFIKMRQYPEAELQGLISEVHSPNGNHREYRFIRYAGFGVANRIAAHIHYVGNAAYQIPSGFNTPQAS